MNTRIRHVAIVATVALLVAILTATTVYAMLYNISTNDGTISDWTGISLYQTDPVDTGDRNDAVAAWLAAGPVGSSQSDRELFFRLQVASSPALTDDFAAVAQVSCDDPNTFETAQDRAIFYVPNCSGAGAERVGIMPGDQGGVTLAIGPTSGQRVVDQLEWGAKVSDIESGDSGWPVIDCSGAIWVRFLTADATNKCVAPYSGNAVAHDVVDGRENIGINVPTVVEVQQINASEELPSLQWPIIVGLLVGSVVFVGGLLARRFRTGH